MNAFVIAKVVVKDKEKMQQYAAAAAPTIAQHGGEILMRGAFGAALVGQSEPHAAAVIRFPDLDAATDWIASDAYQKIVPLRKEAGDMTFLAYSIPQ